MSRKNRLKESAYNISNYLKDELLCKQKCKKIVFDTYLNNHKESLEVLDMLVMHKKSFLWIIVICYYSMFYLANALLCKLGYKVGDKLVHKVTADALLSLVGDKLTHFMINEYKTAYEEAMAISDNLVQSFDFERLKRARFQYETTEEIKASKAKTSFERAKRFSLEITKFIDSF